MKVWTTDLSEIFTDLAKSVFVFSRDIAQFTILFTICIKLKDELFNEIWISSYKCTVGIAVSEMVIWVKECLCFRIKYR